MLLWLHRGLNHQPSGSQSCTLATRLQPSPFLWGPLRPLNYILYAIMYIIQFIGDVPCRQALVSMVFLSLGCFSAGRCLSMVPVCETDCPPTFNTSHLLWCICHFLKMWGWHTSFKRPPTLSCRLDSINVASTVGIHVPRFKNSEIYVHYS